MKNYSGNYLLLAWLKYCRTNSCLHDMSRVYFKKYNMMTTIPAIVLASISGVSLLGIGAKKECSADVDVAVICLGVCGLLSGTLMSINRFLKYPELQEQHDLFCDNFEILHNDIQLHTSLQGTTEPMFRTNIEFMKYCKYKMDNLIDKAPPIPTSVSKKLAKVGLDSYRSRSSMDVEVQLSSCNINMQHLQQKENNVIEENTNIHHQELV